MLLANLTPPPANPEALRVPRLTLPAKIKLVPTPYRCYAVVSRGQIARNYRNVRSVVGPGVEVAAVVKADAYGHGLLEIAETLVGPPPGSAAESWPVGRARTGGPHAGSAPHEQGARWLAVASVEEGALLREGGIHEARILVMGGFLPYESDALLQYKLTPVVHSIEQLRQLESVGRSQNCHLPYHLKFDSGMGRLGIRTASPEVLEAVTGAGFARLEGLMTHLASPSDFSSPQTCEQLAAFDALAAALRAAGAKPEIVHAASTGAVAYGRREAWRDMVRVGLAIYGYVPDSCGSAPRLLLDVQPALAWKARLLAVKDVPEGAPIGYGATFRAPRAMRIGIAGAGYADGIFRQLSNCGKVIADGKLTSILGAVSMDLTAIDLSHTAALAPGDEITLLGREGGVTLGADEVARAAGTIPYEILCGIGSRVKRVYVE
jgi:alanine racemase